MDGKLLLSLLQREQVFIPAIPCVPIELVAFRQRIGEPREDLVLKESIRINRTKYDDNLAML